jgi:hypothetical protein
LPEGGIATKRRKDPQKLNFELLAGQMDEDKVRKIETERWRREKVGTPMFPKLIDVKMARTGARGSSGVKNFAPFMSCSDPGTRNFLGGGFLGNC